MKRKRWNLILLLVIFCLLSAFHVGAEAKGAQSITLNRTGVTTFKGKRFALKATIPSGADKESKIKWWSKDEKVATVTPNGKVIVVGYGKSHMDSV